jgi:hypothetical protein
MPDDFTSQTLDGMAWLILFDEAMRALDPADRRRVVATLEDAARLVGHAFPVEYAGAIAHLKETTRLRAPTTTSPLAAAYARCNPRLLTVKELRDAVDPTLPDHWYNNARHVARRNRYGKRPEDREQARLTRIAPRKGHGHCEPLHPESGEYYSEYYSAGDRHPNARLAQEHYRSPWYLFHAWAWGRRMYAEWLEANHYQHCDLSGETLLTLRRDNPEDGSGVAWLHLATRRVARLYATQTTIMALPVPYAACSAHEVNDWPDFYAEGKPGTPAHLIAKALNKERVNRGLPLARFDARTRTLDVGMGEDYARQRQT